MPVWAFGTDTTTAYDDASRVTDVSTISNGSTAFTIVHYDFDDVNHQVSERQTINPGSLTRTVITSDDDDGNPITLSVTGIPQNYSFSYDYTQRSQLAHINKGGSQFFEYKYDENSNLRSRTNVLQGGDYTYFTHDPGNRLTACNQFTAPGVPAFAVSDYDDYDLVDNLKSIGRRRDQTSHYIGEQFGYDDGKQLKSVSYKVDLGNRTGSTGDTVEEIDKDSGKELIAMQEADPVREPGARATPTPGLSVPIALHHVDYTNDPIRRTKMTETIDNAVTETNYVPNLLNQYTAVGGHPTPTYDGNFNLTSFDDWTFVYDADNRLISANAPGHSATFVYDGLGRCVRRTIDGDQTVITYDDWKPIIEWDGTGQFVAWNLYGPGPDEILIRYQPNTGGSGDGGYLHYHLDGLGNVEFLLSVDNLGLEQYSYDAFGQPTIKNWDGGFRETSKYGNRFLFTGREYIYTLGIYDYRHRMYHPQLGKFMQVDPIGFKSDPANLYRYCMGNPIGHSDPTGLVDRNDNRFPRDFMWDFAAFGDSGNSFQGEAGDYFRRLGYSANQTTGGGANQGAPKPIVGPRTPQSLYREAKAWVSKHHKELDPDTAKVKLGKFDPGWDGHTNSITGRIKLNIDHLKRVSDYVRVFVHELMHRQDGFWKTGFDNLNPWHPREHEIDQKSINIQKDYDDGEGAKYMPHQ